MKANEKYDVAIAGGGLAGLSLSILLAKQRYTVIVFEKEQYPFHKVCGEYVSLESREFLEKLGLPLHQMQLPVINQLILTSSRGNNIKQRLPLGGFGISRYLLDNELYKLAKASGVQVLEKTKVNDIQFKEDNFFINTSAGIFCAKVAVATFGKRSNIDVKWNRKFTGKKASKLNNYIGVKYHIKANQPADTISLHIFKDGYCGLSKIEEDKFSLCYLTTAKNLKANNNSIRQMEGTILKKNPCLQKIFSESEFIFHTPEIISQISFDKKTLAEDHTLMIGDAAGMITPLCGNGMSMAFHGSKIGYDCIHSFLRNKISRKEMEQKYIITWNRNFAGRMRAGRIIQRFFFTEWLSNVLIAILKYWPFILRRLIKSTHGKPF